MWQVSPSLQRKKKNQNSETPQRTYSRCPPSCTSIWSRFISHPPHTDDNQTWVDPSPWNQDVCIELSKSILSSQWFCVLKGARSLMPLLCFHKYGVSCLWIQYLLQMLNLHQSGPKSRSGYRWSELRLRSKPSKPNQTNPCMVAKLWKVEATQCSDTYQRVSGSIPAPLTHAEESGQDTAPKILVKKTRKVLYNNQSIYQWTCPPGLNLFNPLHVWKSGINLLHENSANRSSDEQRQRVYREMETDHVYYLLAKSSTRDWNWKERRRRKNENLYCCTGLENYSTVKYIGAQQWKLEYGVALYSPTLKYITIL